MGAGERLMTRTHAVAAALAIVLGMLAAFMYGTFVAGHARTAGQQSVTCTHPSLPNGDTKRNAGGREYVCAGGLWWHVASQSPERTRT
jgi:hypothetical protein